MAMQYAELLTKLVFLVLIVLVAYLLHRFYISSNAATTREKFATGAPYSLDGMAQQDGKGVVPFDKENTDTYRAVDSIGVQYPKECFPQDKLTPEDLLPLNAANSLWAEVNPSGQGDVANQNFLTAGYHMGIDTIGQTLRNPNMQLRSEPPNPRIQVSPWQQSTIEPDMNRRPLEIGGSGCE
jgi:hypothetical protein